MRLNHFLPAAAFALSCSTLLPVVGHAAPTTRPVSRSTTLGRLRATRVTSPRGTPTARVPSHTAVWRDVANAPSTLDQRKETAKLGANPSPTRLAVKILLAAINVDRKGMGLDPLTLDSRLSSCSRRHSAHMALLGYISHDQFPADVCVAHKQAGENVGFEERAPDGAVVQLHRLMMDEGPCGADPCTGTKYEAHGHYLNLVNPRFKHVGIGIVVRHNGTWLTEDFTG